MPPADSCLMLCGPIPEPEHRMLRLISGHMPCGTFGSMIVCIKYSITTTNKYYLIMNVILLMLVLLFVLTLLLLLLFALFEWGRRRARPAALWKRSPAEALSNEGFLSYIVIACIIEVCIQIHVYIYIYIHAYTHVLYMCTTLLIHLINLLQSDRGPQQRGLPLLPPLQGGAQPPLC